MPAILGQHHLNTWWRGQRPTRHRWWGWLGDTGGFWGGTHDFKHHCCMLLVPAEEMRTANSHAPLPHPQGVFFGLLHSKPVHRSAVQHPVYEILNLVPVILPDELQCFGTVGPVYSVFWGGWGGPWVRTWGVVGGMAITRQCTSGPPPRLPGLPGMGLGLNHGRSQILDAPAQATPANVPGVVHNQLLCYIQSLRHSLICTRASDMPLPGSGCTLGAGGSCQA